MTRLRTEVRGIDVAQFYEAKNCVCNEVNDDRKLIDVSFCEREFLNSKTCKRFEVITAVTVKNVVFWDIKPQFVLHRRHITSPLQSPAG
jgi:hypothetical protein